MPLIRASAREEAEIEANYPGMDVVLIPSPQGVIEIRRVSDQDADELVANGSEHWEQCQCRNCSGEAGG